MNGKYIFISLVFCWCIWSCEKGKDLENKIEVLSVSTNSNQELTINDIAEDIEEVRLELTDESLIANIIKVERTEKYIFVMTSNGPSVLQFDRKGKFIKSMGKKGDGPEEVLRIITFTIDPENRYLYLASPNKIVIYNFENTFVGQIDGFAIPNYMHFQNGKLEVFLTRNNKSKSGEGFVKVPTMFRIFNDGSIADSVGITEISLKQQIRFMMMDAKYYSNSSRDQFFYLPVLFPEPIVRDTLYVVNELGFQPVVKLDFGAKAITNDGKKAVNIWGMHRSDRYLLARYSFDRKSRYFVYDFKSEKGYNLNSGIDGGEFSDGDAVELMPDLSETNAYYFSVKKIENQVKDEPNPTLYFVNLKR